MLRNDVISCSCGKSELMLWFQNGRYPLPDKNWYECSACGKKGDVKETVDEAVDAWNKLMETQK